MQLYSFNNIHLCPCGRYVPFSQAICEAAVCGFYRPAVLPSNRQTFEISPYGLVFVLSQDIASPHRSDTSPPPPHARRFSTHPPRVRSFAPLTETETHGFARNIWSGSHHTHTAWCDGRAGLSSTFAHDKWRRRHCPETATLLLGGAAMGFRHPYPFLLLLLYFACTSGRFGCVHTRTRKHTHLNEGPTFERFDDEILLRCQRLVRVRAAVLRSTLVQVPI